MTNYLKGKSVLITGSASGFGRLLSEEAGSMGAVLTCVDVAVKPLEASVAALQTAGIPALAITGDVSRADDMRRAVEGALSAYGRVDILVNNAGIMPLGFYADHAQALDKWHDCIDVNIKGVVNGIAAVYDHMMARGEGHIVNLSSIFGNFPVAGSNVYGATKAAVNFLSESLRVESQGKIKVTTVRPTGVLSTGITGHIINREAAVGATGHLGESHRALFAQLMDGSLPEHYRDPNNPKYVSLDPNFVVDQIIYAMNQPRGVSLGDITVRATGDHYIL